MRDAMGLAGLERQLAVVLKVHVEIRHSLIDGHGLAGRGIGIASRGSRSSVVAVDVDGGAAHGRCRRRRLDDCRTGLHR